ncbi:MAG TPA: glycosyltransferase family 39 protein [Rhizomicrobium sp.]|nr:glycosyltransferase family 39 protein [Rhizomicrobium sp.]
MTDSQVTGTAAGPGPAPASAQPGFLAPMARRPFALLALLGLLLWLPGVLSLPALDRDESRFAQSSRQMVESGNLVDIRFGHVPRYKKPIGIYWLQAASAAVAGGGVHSRIWTYRLPSLLGGIAAAWATAWCAMAFASGEVALLAGLLMLSSVLLTAEATIATTDAVLLAFTLAVQGVLLRVYRAAREPDVAAPSARTVWLGWVACAGGVLVKFPVVPAVAIATIAGLVAWDRDWRWLSRLKPVRGLFLVLLLAMPWLVAITLQSRGAFLEQSLGNDFAAKIAGGQESHGMPPGYYLLLSAVAFWPTVLFVAPGIALGIARRGEPAIRFLLTWAGTWWALVEAVPTKLPHYVLPAYPALAILAALFVLAPAANPRWLGAARWIAGVQFVIGAALLTAAPVLLPRLYGAGAVWWLAAPAAVGAALAAGALVLAIRRAFGSAAVLSVAAMLVFVPALTAGAGPRLERLWISERLKPLVAAASRPGDPPPALAGYQEPSLVFALGKDVLLTNGAGAADATVKSGGLALVEDAEKGAFLARLAELEADAAADADLSGFNYSRGKPVHITLYRVTRTGP